MQRTAMLPPMRLRRSALPIAALAVAVAFACSGEDTVAEGDHPGSAAVAGTAGASATGGAPDGGGTGGTSASSGSSGTGGAGGCATGILCGAQGDCCAAATECVAGACVPECPSGVRCGGACCAAGDACVAGQCVTPTDPCLDSVDCAPDEFCEPAIGRCLPDLPDPDPCEVARPPSKFEPVLKWHWPDPTPIANPSYYQAVSAPIVVPTDQSHEPSVAVTTCNAIVQTPNPGYLRLLDGATGAELWDASTDAMQTLVDCTHSPAAADIDADGKVEFIAMASSWELVAFDETGKLEWRSTRPGGAPYLFPTDMYASAPVLADLDVDGKGEVVLGGVVFDSAGVLVAGDGKDAVGSLGAGSCSIVADVDGNGKQEVLGGNVAYRNDGTTLWSQASLDDGFPAIADFELDGTPELVVSNKSGLRVQNAVTGAELHSLPMSIIEPGLPVIADFDGDGKNEIGVQNRASANDCHFAVYEYDAVTGLSEKWKSPLIQCSIYAAATAFDFEGDGTVEILAHDDCFIVALDGSTGAQLLRLSAPHATWTEFVSLADVDGDLSADILFSAHDVWNGAPIFWEANCGYGAGEGLRHGVFVYSDPDGAWMPTRRVWNQQAYHITNVRGDGALPKPENASWGPKGFNNYRVAAQGKGATKAADLVVSLSAALLGFCPGEVKLVALVENQGSLGVPAGVVVRFYEGTPPGGTLLGSGQTTQPLLPGASEAVELVVPMLATSSFYVEVDGSAAGVKQECIDTNNSGSVEEVSCAKLPR